MMTSRSPSISRSARVGRTISSPRTSMARVASRRGTRTQYTVDSRSVAALNEPPTPSIASEIARVEGKRVVPLNVMCSMKCATPACSGVSRREPARTYAAMETERAPGSLALITRGPAGSAVRSNIGGDGTGRPARDEHAPLTLTARGRRLSFRPDRRGTGTPPRSRSSAGGAVDPRGCDARGGASSERSGGGSMASTRLRLASLVAATAVVVGACGSSPAASGAAGSGGTAECQAGAAQAGANLQVPDVVAGKFNVAMVLIGPHSDGGWSQAHYEGLQYLCQHMPDSHVAYV